MHYLIILTLTLTACGPSQADGDAACRSADACHASGECWYRPSAAAIGPQVGQTGVFAGQCEARSEQDCERSSNCDLLGQCTVEGGRCVAGSNSDCRRSDICRLRRLCVYYDGRCISDRL